MRVGVAARRSLPPAARPQPTVRRRAPRLGTPRHLRRPAPRKPSRGIPPPVLASRRGPACRVPRAWVRCPHAAHPRNPAPRPRSDSLRVEGARCRLAPPRGRSVGCHRGQREGGSKGRTIARAGRPPRFGRGAAHFVDVSPRFGSPSPQLAASSPWFASLRRTFARGSPILTRVSHLSTGAPRSFGSLRHRSARVPRSLAPLSPRFTSLSRRSGRDPNSFARGSPPRARGPRKRTKVPGKRAESPGTFGRTPHHLVVAQFDFALNMKTGGRRSIIS